MSDSLSETDEPGFDWSEIEHIQHENVRESKGAKQVIRNFLRLQFSESDFQVIQVPVVFNLLKLLQQSLQIFVEKFKKQKKKKKQIKKDMKKLEKSVKCPVCSTLIKSPKELNKHIFENHRHVYNAWTAIQHDECDQNSLQVQQLWGEIAALRAELKRQDDEYTSLWKDHHCWFDLPGVKYESEESQFKQDIGKKYRTVPKLEISRPERTVAIIPQETDGKEQRLLNRKRRYAFNKDDVVERISTMMFSGVSDKEMKEVRKKYKRSCVSQVDDARKLWTVLHISGLIYQRSIFDDTSIGALFSDCAEYEASDPSDEILLSEASEKTESSKKKKKDKKKDKDKSKKKGKKKKDKDKKKKEKKTSDESKPEQEDGNQPLFSALLGNIKKEKEPEDPEAQTSNQSKDPGECSMTSIDPEEDSISNSAPSGQVSDNSLEADIADLLE